MGLTAWAIDKSRVTLVTALVVAGAGYQSYVNMPRAEDPGFVIRVALVITRFPGASPERVEQLITDKLEKAVQEMPELDYITSNSKTGVSELMVNFKESYRDMRPIFDSLRRKIDSARGDLPDGVIGPFVNDEFGDVFGTIVTITGSDFEYAELKLIADEVRDGAAARHRCCEGGDLRRPGRARVRGVQQRPPVGDRACRRNSCAIFWRRATSSHRAATSTPAMRSSCSSRRATSRRSTSWVRQ